MDTLPYRIGYGYDIHSFQEGRKLILGGVEIPSEVGLIGHSDADVLSHAIADAILGACGLKDIGYYFPNTDPNIEGISSLKIIEKAVSEADNTGYVVGNVDCTLIAEKPKIGPHINTIKSALGTVLNITPDRIGIKATTNEGIGDLGRAEGMAAQAACLLMAKSMA